MEGVFWRIQAIHGIPGIFLFGRILEKCSDEFRKEFPNDFLYKNLQWFLIQSLPKGNQKPNQAHSRTNPNKIFYSQIWIFKTFPKFGTISYPISSASPPIPAHPLPSFHLEAKVPSEITSRLRNYSTERARAGGRRKGVTAAI